MDSRRVRHEQLSFVIARWLVRNVGFRLLLDLDLRGMENVPPAGSFIVACNHVSNVDPVLLLAIFPRRPRFMAKVELADVAVLRPLLRWSDAVLVNRASPGRDALRAAQDAVSRGIPFGVFPEGTRSRTGRLARARTGIGVIALRSKVPVLPVAVYGTQNAFRGGVPHLRTKASLTIGEAIEPSEIGAAGDPQVVSDLIMRRIAAMLPESARGEYGEAVRNPVGQEVNPSEV